MGIIIQIAATYIGTVVGAGFASGLSILQFFTVYGPYGLAGIVLSTALFIWVGTKMMVLSRRIQAFSYQQFNNYLFGPKVGKAVNAVSFIILFGVSAVMLSGTGSIFEEQLSLPSQLGIAFSLLFVYWILTKELKGVMILNSLVVPMMLVFIAVIGLKYAGSGGLLSMTPDQAEQVADFKWIISPFAYAALNFATLQAVLVPLGSEVKDEKSIVWGGVLGGIGLGLMLLISHLSMNSMMPGIMEFSIPMAEVIRSLGKWVHILFLFVIYGEIITTLIGNVFGMSRQLQSITKLTNNQLVILILAACWLISQFGFTSLLSFLYELFGYAGLLLLFFLAAKRMPEKS